MKYTQDEITQIVTLIGVILSFIVGAAGLWVGIRNSRNTTFINSVTTSRIQYIQDLRNAIAEFCGLFYRYKLLVDNNKDLSIQKLEVLAVADKLKYLIILHLNPEDIDWDKKIVSLIDSIRESIDNNPTDKIDELITLTQYLLKLEWEGAKLESQKGILSKRVKRRLYKKHVHLYEENLKLRQQ